MKRRIHANVIFLGLFSLLALNSCGTPSTQVPASVSAVGDFCSVKTPRCLFSGVVAKMKTPAGETVTYCKIRQDKPMICK
jgi:hypothetical protein